MTPEKIETLKTMMREFIQLFGWNALEEILVAELDFRLVETRRTYHRPDGSEVIITEGEVQTRHCPYGCQGYMARAAGPEPGWYCVTCDTFEPDDQEKARPGLDYHEENVWTCSVCNATHEGKQVYCDECGQSFDEHGRPCRF